MGYEQVPLHYAPDIYVNYYSEYIYLIENISFLIKQFVIIYNT